MTNNEMPDQTSEEFTQSEEFVIQDLDTLKVVADPLRLEVIELIFDHAHTVKQIANKLSIPPSKLYYHMNLLEKHGLISIARTRVVSGIVEKSYQASARNIRVMKGLLTPQRPQQERDEGVALIVDAILTDARQDIKQNTASGLIDLTEADNPRSLRISRTTTRFTAQQAKAFHQRLSGLIEEFQQAKADPANTNEQTDALVFAFYPTARGTPPPDTDTSADDPTS
jgi:DNA-binding transcriptional ArsR family regulator